MPPPPRHPHADVADALLAVAPLLARWTERLLAHHDPPLTPAQYLALRVIARDGVGGAELARRTGVSGPAVSQLVAGLSDAGLVSSAVRPEDRRRHELALTEAGAAAFASAGSLLRGRVSELLGGVPRPEADALARLLPRVAAALAGEPPPRRPKPPPRLRPRRGPGPH